jgi:hypothetical protein
MIKFNDEIYKNKSYDYLFPLLKVYGQGFLTRFNNLYKLGIFIGDMNYYNTNPYVVPSLYIVIKTPTDNSKESSVAYWEYLEEFLNFVKHQPYFESNYMIDRDKQVFILKLPAELSNCIDQFMMGKYSQMFTKEQVMAYFTLLPNDSVAHQEKNDKTLTIRQILLRDMGYLPTYVQKINKLYETTMTEEQMYHHEFDTPPDLKHEILNY